MSDGKGLASLSNHPPHITDRTGVKSPSSFIPFCYFGEKALGKLVTNFSEPVCNLGVPKIVDEQLCYSIDMNNELEENNINQGEDYALHLYLDYNEDRSTQMDMDEANQVELGKQLHKKKEAKVIIDTISSFVAFGCKITAI